MSRNLFYYSIILVLAASSFLSSCKKERPSLTIGEDKLVKIFYDLHTANYIIKKAPVDMRDSLASEYTQQIFANHNTTKEEFEKNLELLQKHPEFYVSFYKKLEGYSDSLMNKFPEGKQK